MVECPRLSEVLQYRGHVSMHMMSAGKPSTKDSEETTTRCDQCGFTNVPNQMILEIYSRSQRSG